MEEFQQFMKEEKAKKYWMVHNQERGIPTVQHDTFEKAQEEATRLCEKRNKAYYILECVGVVRPLVLKPPIEYVPAE